VDRHPLPAPPAPADVDLVTRTFRALSDATRARTVLALGTGESTVSELVTLLHLPQSTVSRHLATLRAAGVVTARRDGNHVHYRLANSHVGDMVREAFAHAEHDRLGLPDHPGVKTAVRGHH
jgi:DNA-binding transcriptional ArsR family regulator